MPYKQIEDRKECSRRWYLKNHDKAFASAKRWNTRNKEKVLEIQRNYRHNNAVSVRKKANRYNREVRNEYRRGYNQEQRDKYPEKYEARRLVNNAIRRRELVRQNCWCGKPGHAHHEDYSLPFQILWRCPKHHAELHRKYK